MSDALRLPRRQVLKILGAATVAPAVAEGALDVPPAGAAAIRRRAVAATLLHGGGKCDHRDARRADHYNVFVVDGSSFTTASEKNPTLTILALTWRAADYLADELRSGRL